VACETTCCKERGKQTYAEGTPDTELAGVADSRRDAVTAGNLDRAEIFVEEALDRVRDGRELVHVQELALVLGVRHVHSDTAKCSVVVSAERVDLLVGQPVLPDHR
jgi:hypothetical protein